MSKKHEKTYLQRLPIEVRQEALKLAELTDRRVGVVIRRAVNEALAKELAQKKAPGEPRRR